MNKVILMGRLTRDPETRVSTGDAATSVTRYSLAVDRRFKRDGDQSADFINCVAWEKTAEFVTRFFNKGDMVALTGSLRTRNYEDKNKQQRTIVEVLVERAYFTGGKSEKTPQKGTQKERIDVEFDGELPF